MDNAGNPDTGKATGTEGFLFLLIFVIIHSYRYSLLKDIGVTSEALVDTADWKQVVAAASHHQTPFYLIWTKPFDALLAQLHDNSHGATKFRSWYSFKSQPVPELALHAKTKGMGIEVVSRYELYAALKMGFQPRTILVNGVGKNTWLSRDVPELNVVFDSLHEIGNLAATAAEQRWRCGIRIAVSQQKNADYPEMPVQFGICPSDLAAAQALMKQAGTPIEILHFHLRSNVPTADDYVGAISELASIANRLSIAPSVLDIGGGLTEPIPDFPGRPQIGFPIADYARAGHRINALFPKLSEIWAENGRFLLAPSAVLVATIIGSKQIGKHRVLICDGGRTNNAMPSEWERHFVDLAGDADWDRTIETAIYGPTCMAYDTIFWGVFPRNATIGDRVIYFNAGAYHLPWETRFSTGLCKVLWTNDGSCIEVIRSDETAAEWLATWRGYD